MAGEGFSKHPSTGVSLRNNRNLQRKKNIFEKGRSFISRGKKYVKEEKGDLAFKKIPEDELNLVKEKINSDIHHQRKKIRYVFIILLVTSIVISIRLFSFQNAIESKVAIKNQELYKKENTELFNYLLLSGDDWMSKQKYHNAIFQYKLALKLFPNDSLANYRLLSAYDDRCENENKDCDRFEELLKKLLE